MQGVNMVTSALSEMSVGPMTVLSRSVTHIALSVSDAMHDVGVVGGEVEVEVEVGVGVGVVVGVRL